jgi:uncharacterized protein
MSFSSASRRERRIVAVLVLVLLTGPVLSGCGAGEEAYVEAPGGRIYVEIADTPEERAEGLMFRSSLPADRGMLFVFPEPQPLAFWMKNTSIPLSIAYIDRDGRILEIHYMEPYSLESVPSRQPALYALEVNRGTFERLGIEPGDRLRLPEDLSAQR